MTPSQIRSLFVMSGMLAGAGLLGLLALTIRQDAFKHALQVFERTYPERVQAIREQRKAEEGTGWT